MSDDGGLPHKKKIQITRQGMNYYRKIGREDRSEWCTRMRLGLMRDWLSQDRKSVSPLVLRGIQRVHDDMMLRLAVVQALSRQEFKEKLELINDFPPEESEHRFLPEMISAALSENQIRLLLSEEGDRSRRRKR